MKVKPPEMSRALARPDGDIRFYLLTGPDEAACVTGAHALAKAMGEDAERIDLQSAALKNDPAKLADEAAAISLFGGARFIQLTIAGSGDDCREAVEALLEAGQAGNPVVGIGPGVSAKSKLMKLVEASPLGMATIHYTPNEREMGGIAQALAREYGLQVDRDMAQQLGEMVSGDRLLLAREMEKLALYLDAAPDSPKPLTQNAIAALGAETHEEDIARAIDVSLGGQVNDLQAMLESIDATGLNEIRLIRAMGNRARLLARLRADVDQGRSPSQAVEAARVFFKEKASVARQLAIWDTASTARIMARLQQTERAIKAPKSPGGIVMRKLLVDLAYQAARRSAASGRRVY